MIGVCAHVDKDSHFRLYVLPLLPGEHSVYMWSKSYLGTVHRLPPAQKLIAVPVIIYADGATGARWQHCIA